MHVAFLRNFRRRLDIRFLAAFEVRQMQMTCPPHLVHSFGDKSACGITAPAAILEQGAHHDSFDGNELTAGHRQLADSFSQRTEFGLVPTRCRVRRELRVMTSRVPDSEATCFGVRLCTAADVSIRSLQARPARCAIALLAVFLYRAGAQAEKVLPKCPPLAPASLRPFRARSTHFLHRPERPESSPTGHGPFHVALKVL